MNKLNTQNPDLLKEWLTVDVLEAMNDARWKIDYNISPLDPTNLMWSNRYAMYHAELIRRNAYVARSY
jgi:hypothetical protein